MPMPPMAANLPGCILYFFLFVSLGSMSPYLPVIWRSKGLSGEEHGARQNMVFSSSKMREFYRTPPLR